MGGSASELHQIQRLSKLGAGPEDDRERVGPRHLLPQREAGDLPHSHCKQQTAPHLPERDRLLQYKVSGYVIRCRQVLEPGGSLQVYIDVLSTCVFILKLL